MTVESSISMMKTQESPYQSNFNADRSHRGLESSEIFSMKKILKLLQFLHVFTTLWRKSCQNTKNDMTEKVGNNASLAESAPRATS